MQQDIVACARSWLGTRFHHQGRLKKTVSHKGGVDCLGLLIGVAKELNLNLAAHDDVEYSHSPDTVRLRNTLAGLMQEIPLEGILPGDIALLNIDGQPQHLGIISEYGQQLGIIHAYAPTRAVVEHPLDMWWKCRIVAVFRVY